MSVSPRPAASTAWTRVEKAPASTAAWKRGDAAAARELLATAHAARGPDWKPEGTTAEGDVAARQHREETPLSRFWESWDGTVEPAAVFSQLGERLAG